MDLLTNPFLTLGATMHDNRRRIMALAEERSLVSDEATEAAVNDAKAVLIHPRRRLTAEIGWLPGLVPERILEIIAMLKQDPAKVRSLVDLPSLARANLLGAGLTPVVEQLSKEEVVKWILEIAHVHDATAAEPTMTLLNKERSMAGFPAIADLQVVNAELRSQRQYYGQVLKEALNRLPFRSLVDVVTITVDEATNHGEHQAPILIDDLVDGFELKVQEFFEVETEKIQIMVERIQRAGENDESYGHISRLASQLEDIVKNWDWVAQPIQVSARSRGTDHDLSHRILFKIKNLALDLFDKHHLLAIPWKLTVLQQEVFAEITSVVEQSEEDATTLFYESAKQFYKDFPNVSDVGEAIREQNKHEHLQLLHMAAWLGHAEGIKALLSAGAQLDAKDEDGRTPFDIAVQRGHAQEITELLSAGIQMDAKGQKEQPFNIAKGLLVGGAILAVGLLVLGATAKRKRD